MKVALQLIAGMVGLHGLGPAFPASTIARLALCLVLVWAAPNTLQIMSLYGPALGKNFTNPYVWLTWRPNFMWALLIGFVAGAAILGIGGTTEFLYFQF